MNHLDFELKIGLGTGLLLCQQKNSLIFSSNFIIFKHAPA
jgi:hypothetical protein